MNLLELPTEILGQVLANLQYHDLASAFSSCRALNSFSDDQLLWRSTYLHDFDDPRLRLSSATQTTKAILQDVLANFDWHTRLQQQIMALRCFSRPEDAYQYCDGDAYDRFVSNMLGVIDTTRLDGQIDGSNIDLLPLSSAIPQEVDALVRGTLQAKVPLFEQEAETVIEVLSSTRRRTRSWFWEPSPGHPMTRSRAALQADKIVRHEDASRLHVLYGFTDHEDEDERSAGRARRICYDWSLTNEKNEYGPWKDDGTGATDWRRLEAVASVVTKQFLIAARGRVTLPLGFRYSIPHRVLSDPTVPEDWAGIQRKWIGTYVFMHWEDLLEYNEFRDTNSRPTLENMPEACGGLMKLDLKLNMELQDDAALKTGLPMCTDLPPLYFSGLSRSEDWQMATGIRGMCCLAPGGREVRWRYIVHYGGADQWQLEGVQPGGIRSGMVYGTWTSVLHEETGPVGPFLYAPEELCTRL